MTEQQMKAAATVNAIESMKAGAQGDEDKETFYFRQAWALCPRTTLNVRSAGKKAQG